MKSLIKKYPAELMGLYFLLTFLLLAIVSMFIPAQNNIVTIPPILSVPIFTLLLSGLIGMYLFANNHLKSWRKYAELFIMLASICASLSDGFWIFSLVASIITLIGSGIEKKSFPKDKLFIVWAILLILVALSSAFAVDSPFLSYGAMFGLLIYCIYFMAIYQHDFYQDRGVEFVQRIAVLMSFSIVTTVLFSWWHYFMPYHIHVLIFQFQPQTGYGDSFGMASIYGQWPTHSSAFLSLAFWVLLGIRIQFMLTPLQRRIISLGIVFAFVGAISTLSRNAFLFLALSIGISLILLVQKNKKYLWLLLGSGGVFAGILAFLVTNFSKWADLFKNPLQQNTIADRLNQYVFAWEQFIAYPNKWTGIGLMNFGPFYRRIQNDPNLTDYLHQLFLSMLLEMGILGFVVFLVLLVMIGYKIIQNYRQNPSNVICLIVYLAWLSTGVFDNWLYFVWSSSLFMMIVAVGSRPRRTL